MAAALISTMAQIPLYSALRRVFSLPSEQNVFEASHEINGISYGLGPVGKDVSSPSQNLDAARKVAQLLQIRTSFDHNN